MIHGYDHIASVLLQVADPKIVTRKDDLFELTLPLDTDLEALGARIRRKLRAFMDATLMSIAFNRTTDRAAEFWIVIPKDPMSVRLGTFTYRGET
mgnify:CR=1 FL=1